MDYVIIVTSLWVFDHRYGSILSLSQISLSVVLTCSNLLFQVCSRDLRGTTEGIHSREISIREVYCSSLNSLTLSVYIDATNCQSSSFNHNAT
jgi:hypothetical protein